MTPDIAIVLAILTGAVLLFVTGWVRMDIVALMVLALLGFHPPKGVMGCLTAKPDLAIPLEFSHPLGSARPTCLAIDRKISAAGLVLHASTGRGAWSPVDAAVRIVWLARWAVSCHLAHPLPSGGALVGSE
jgi:hypothetical protein